MQEYERQIAGATRFSMDSDPIRYDFHDNFLFLSSTEISFKTAHILRLSRHYPGQAEQRMTLQKFPR